MLPQSHYFRDRLHKTSSRPVTGGTAEVWRVKDDRGLVYAAKEFRVNMIGEEYKIKAGPSLFKRK